MNNKIEIILNINEDVYVKLNNNAAYKGKNNNEYIESLINKDYKIIYNKNNMLQKFVELEQYIIEYLKLKKDFYYVLDCKRFILNKYKINIKKERVFSLFFGNIAMSLEMENKIKKVKNPINNFFETHRGFIKSDNFSIYNKNEIKQPVNNDPEESCTQSMSKNMPSIKDVFDGK